MLSEPTPDQLITRLSGGTTSATNMLTESSARKAIFQVPAQSILVQVQSLMTSNKGLQQRFAWLKEVQVHSKFCSFRPRRRHNTCLAAK